MKVVSLRTICEYETHHVTTKMVITPLNMTGMRVAFYVHKWKVIRAVNYFLVDLAFDRNMRECCSICL
jgi:hypothetical protein